MADTALLFIVDPGRPSVFRYLQKRFEDQPNIHIMWDRRRGERRRPSPGAEAERRRSDRRDSPPDFLATPGFIIVPQREGAGPSTQDEAQT